MQFFIRNFRVWRDSYSEARRDLEGTRDKTGFGSVDSDALEYEIFEEAPVDANSVRRDGEARD